MHQVVLIIGVLATLILAPSVDAGGFGDFLRKNVRRSSRSSPARSSTAARSSSAKAGETNRPVRIDSLPTNLAGFLALRDQHATSPQGGAVMFLIAAHLYTQDKDLGNQAFAITLHKKMLVKTGGGYKGWEPAKSFRDWVKRLDGMPYAPRSYIVGASPANGYALPSAPYRYDAFENRYSRGPDGSVKVFVRTTGADFPRPYIMSKNDRGLWKVAGGEGNIYLGVKPPTGTPNGTPLGDGDDL